jgi:hypothetical protein
VGSRSTIHTRKVMGVLEVLGSIGGLNDVIKIIIGAVTGIFGAQSFLYHAVTMEMKYKD